MLIKYSHPTGVSTMRISEIEEKAWRKVCEAEGDSLNATVGWLWKIAPREANFTQYVRDQFLTRITEGEWMP